MSNKFHIGEKGPAPCHAQPGKCPINPDGSEHYSTMEEAVDVYENTVEENTPKTATDGAGSGSGGEEVFTGFAEPEDDSDNSAENQGKIDVPVMSVEDAEFEWLENNPISPEDVSKFARDYQWCLGDTDAITWSSSVKGVAVEALMDDGFDVGDYMSNYDEDYDSGEIYYDLDEDMVLDDADAYPPEPETVWRNGWEYLVSYGQTDWVKDPKGWERTDLRASTANAMMARYTQMCYGENLDRDKLLYNPEAYDVFYRYDALAINEEFNEVMRDPALMKSYLDSGKDLIDFPVFTAIMEKHRKID